MNKSNSTATSGSGLRSRRSDSGAADLPPYPSAPRHRQKRDPRKLVVSRWALLVGLVAAIVVVSAAAGAALFGGGSSAPGVPTAATALATEAATAWVDGTLFHGPRRAGVPADLGRSGPATGGTVEAVAVSGSGGVSSHLFIVAPPAGIVYGLSVVVEQGRIAYPVTVTPLPFAKSVPAGSASGPSPAMVPETGRAVAPRATGPAQAWAELVFGAVAHPAISLGYGVSGPVRVLDEWRPKTGAAFVARIRVPLTGMGPGTARSQAAAAIRRIVVADAGVVTAAKGTETAAAASVTRDREVLTGLQAAVQVATAAEEAAAPAHPLRAAREAGEVVADEKAVAAAWTTLAAGQHWQAVAASQLANAQGAFAAEVAAVGPAVSAATMSVTSVYDVAFDAHGRPMAWAPADYLIGPA